MCNGWSNKVLWGILTRTNSVCPLSGPPIDTIRRQSESIVGKSGGSYFTTTRAHVPYGGVTFNLITRMSDELSRRDSARSPLPNGFRIIKSRVSKRGDLTLVLNPELNRNGFHLEFHEGELHFKTPGPDGRTTILSKGIDDLLGLARVMAEIVSEWNRLPSPGFRVSGSVFPGVVPTNFATLLESRPILIEESARQAWNFSMRESGRFLETLVAARKRGILKPGDLIFARVGNSGEHCQVVVLDSRGDSASSGNEAVLALRMAFASPSLEEVFFVTTMDERTKSSLQRVKDFNPEVTEHVQGEIHQQFGNITGRSPSTKADRRLRDIRRKNLEASGRRPSRRLAPDAEADRDAKDGSVQ